MTCPAARSSCATSSTTAGEVAVPMAAAVAASSGSKPKASSASSTALKQNTLSAIAAANSQRLRRSHCASSRWPSSNTIRPSDRSISTRASPSAPGARKPETCGPSNTPPST